MESMLRSTVNGTDRFDLSKARNLLRLSTRSGFRKPKYLYSEFLMNSHVSIMTNDALQCVAVHTTRFADVANFHLEKCSFFSASVNLHSLHLPCPEPLAFLSRKVNIAPKMVLNNRLVDQKKMAQIRHGRARKSLTARAGMIRLHRCCQPLRKVTHRTATSGFFLFMLIID